MSTTAVSATSGLVKTSNGEYTASSVGDNPTEAQKLALVKEADGNYGTSAPKPAELTKAHAATALDTSGQPAAKASAAVQAALIGLTLGG